MRGGNASGAPPWGVTGSPSSELVGGCRSTSARIAETLYLFSRVARCAECGEIFWGRVQHQRTSHGATETKQLIHAPRGCGRGARTESELSRRLGLWLSSWKLAADAKTRIAAFAATPQRDDGTLVRRRSLEAELGRLAKQHQWGHLTDDDYLEQRRGLSRELDTLPAPVLATEPPADAMRLADDIGKAWSDARVSDDLRTWFVQEWFEEMRIARDSSIELVPREPYRAIVYAATASSTAVWALLGSNQ
jgi:hypothetical protein